MPHISVLCNYCGHKYKDYVYSEQSLKSLKCPICKDHDLQVKPEGHASDSTDIFGYNSDAPKPDAYIKEKK